MIVGAHRDHFGRPGGVLFPGADDNASGTAVILEVARALTKIELRPSRTILFISFSGEERDLLGSRLYTSRPIIPLNYTKAMINIDHAGVGNGRLTVGVTGLDKGCPTGGGKGSRRSRQTGSLWILPRRRPCAVQRSRRADGHRGEWRCASALSSTNGYRRHHRPRNLNIRGSVCAGHDLATGLWAMNGCTSLQRERTSRAD